MIMRKFRYVLLAAVLVAAFGSQGALAQHGHGHGYGHVGVMLDVPLWPLYYPGPYYNPGPYYQPYYPQPPMVMVPATPPVYVEQQAPAPVVQAAPQSYYWYYCAKPQGYYPYVATCPGGWAKVSPQPPGQ
jgi:hypothetical protein